MLQPIRILNTLGMKTADYSALTPRITKASTIRLSLQPKEHNANAIFYQMGLTAVTMILPAEAGTSQLSLTIPVRFEFSPKIVIDTTITDLYIFA